MPKLRRNIHSYWSKILLYALNQDQWLEFFDLVCGLPSCVYTWASQLYVFLGTVTSNLLRWFCQLSVLNSEFSRLSWDSLYLPYSQEIISCGSNVGQLQAHFVFFFSSLRNHCPLLPNVYCMLQFVFIICWFYVGSWIFVCYTILVWSRKL